MNKEEYPEVMARFYDLIYKNARSPVDVDYYLERINESRGKILEAWVGSGRIFLPALKNKADMYGMDISRAMVEKLKESLNPPDHHRVWIQDITELSTPHRFKLVIAPFRVFSHLLHTEQQIKALNNIYEHLEPGGKLIFDLYVPNVSMLATGLDNLEDFSGEYAPGKRIKRIVNMNADVVNQVSSVTMQFVWENDEGKEESYEWNSKMRFYFRYEIEHLIERSRLDLVNIFGDFDQNPLRIDSTEFLVHARKK